MSGEERPPAPVRVVRSPARWERRARRLLRRLGPVVGLAAVAALVVVLDPEKVGRAVTRFNVALVPAIVVLYVAIYALQGVRWHFLLREAGVRLAIWDSLLLNAAGQTITALVPLGDLTRALFASQAGNRDFGTVAATVTVQELTYTLMLIMLALPELFALQLGVGVVAATIAVMVAIVVVLTVSPVFCLVHRTIARIPLLNRLLPAIDDLQQETADLLHRPDTLRWSVLDLLRAVAAVGAFWLVVEGVAPGGLGWWKASFALALSSIGGAISLLPGGVGASEASIAGLLILLGVNAGAAGAAALIQRVLQTGFAFGFGLPAYVLARRRFTLGGLFQVTTHEPQRRAA